MVIRLDAAIQVCHSDKESAAGTFKGTYGMFPLTAWLDNTGECLAVKLRPGNAGANTICDHIDVLAAAIAQIPPAYRRRLLVTVDGAGATIELLEFITRLNTRSRQVHYSVGFDLDERAKTVEDFIRCGKDTGLARLPSWSFALNQAWCIAAAIGCDLPAWFRLLCCDGEMAAAEPQTLRYALLHTTARLVRGQRRRTLKIPRTWPWAGQLHRAIGAVLTMPAPT